MLSRIEGESSQPAVPPALKESGPDKTEVKHRVTVTAGSEIGLLQ
jgi:hypothetical protein